MSSPKHLWSGDWEQQSGKLTPEPPQDSTPPPEGPPESDAVRVSRRTLVISGAAALLLIVGVALAVGLSGGSSKAQRTSARVPTSPLNPSGGAGLVPQTVTTPQQTVTQQPVSPPAQAQIGPTYNWLGMQISDTPSGVTVATVTPGGAADSDGVDPGDVIQSVNDTQIGSMAQLRSVTAKLKIGKQIQITVDRDTAVVTITATLTNRPTQQ